MGSAALRRRVRANLDVIVLAPVFAVFLVTVLASGAAPLGIVGLGVAGAAPIALQAIGVILVLRSDRILNFAQLQVGAVAGFVFFELARHGQGLLLVREVCPSCLPTVKGDNALLQSFPGQFTSQLTATSAHGRYDTLLAVNFWASLVIALVVAAVLGYAVYAVAVWLFRRAPRLIATVVTIGVAQLLASVPGLLTMLFQDSDQLQGQMSVPLPVSTVKVAWAHQPAVFLPVGYVMALVAAVMACALIGLALWRSRTGIAVRAAAEDPARAQTLGISVVRTSGSVWALAGLLSGIATVLPVISTQAAGLGSSAVDANTLLAVLAAVALGRMANLPMAVAGALCLGVVAQVMQWKVGSQAPFSAVLLGIIGGAFLLTWRCGESRAEQEVGAAYLAAKEARPIPPELRNLSVVRGMVRWSGVLLVVALGAFPLIASPGQAGVVSLVFIEAMIALSVLVLTGWAGQVSLGQFAFVGIGAYVAAIIRDRTGLDIVPCTIAAAAVGAMVAVLVGLPALRLRGFHLAVSTLAFGLVVSSLVLDPSMLGRWLPSGIARPLLLGLDLEDERWFYFFCLAALLLCIVVVMGVRRGRTARVLVAVRDNDAAAQSFGVNMVAARLQAFAISGALAGGAGALFVFHEHAVDPVSYIPEVSITIFLVAVVGGLGSIAGPLLGTAFYGLLLLTQNPLLTTLGTGSGLILVLLLSPGGLVTAAYAARDAVLRQVARRHRISVPSLEGRRGSGGSERIVLPPLRGSTRGPALVPVRYRRENGWKKLAQNR
jgi:branched-chain amino acid transport system permease protein